MSKDEKLPKAVAEASFKLFGVTVRAYVLDDGQRILHADDVAALFEAMGSADAEATDPAEAQRYAEFLRGAPK